MKLCSKLSIFLFCAGLFFTLGDGASAVVLRTLRIEDSVNPGQQLAQFVKLKNDQSESIILYPTVEGFTDAGDETGQPIFIPIDPDVYDLPNWINFNNEFIELDPGEEVEVPFVINIPEDASPGGHYATIFFSQDPPVDSEGAQVSIGTKVGTLVILDVSGEVHEQADIATFETYEGAWYNHLPVTFVTRVKNDGNVHFKPQGTIKIKNLLGMTTTSVVANGVQGNVLPNSTRRFEDIWIKNDLILDGGFWNGVKNEFLNFGFGRYTATVELDVGRDEPNIVTEKIAFWVFPWRISLLTILGILLLIILFKAYDNSVVKRAAKVLEVDSSVQKKKKAKGRSRTKKKS